MCEWDGTYRVAVHSVAPVLSPHPPLPNIYPQQPTPPPTDHRITALYSFNPLSLLVLGYIAHMLFHLWRRAQQAVGAVDLVIEGFEPLVDEVAAARASKQVRV